MGLLEEALHKKEIDGFQYMLLSATGVVAFASLFSSESATASMNLDYSTQTAVGWADYFLANPLSLAWHSLALVASLLACVYTIVWTGKMLRKGG